MERQFLNIEHETIYKCDVRRYLNVDLDDVEHLQAGFCSANLSWFACGNSLIILSTATGSEVARWSFTENFVIASVDELNSSESPFPILIVGLTRPDSVEGGLVCCFNIASGRVFRSFHFPYKVSRVAAVHLADSSMLCDDRLLACSILVAVGTTKGETYVFGVMEPFFNASNDSSIVPKSLECVEFHTNEWFAEQTCLKITGTFYGYALNERRPVDVSALHFIHSSEVLAVGYLFGEFALYSLLNGQLLFGSYDGEDRCLFPVCAFACQEPENDPRSVLYIWVCRAPDGGAVACNADDSFTSADLSNDGTAYMTFDMYQVLFGKRFADNASQPVYADFEGIFRRFTYEQPTRPLRLVRVSTVVNAACNLRKLSDISTDDHAIRDTSLVHFTWLQAPDLLVSCLFDLNAWYFAQMPSGAGKSKQLPFMAFHNLLMSSRSFFIKDCKIDPATVVRYPFVRDGCAMHYATASLSCAYQLLAPDWCCRGNVPSAQASVVDAISKSHALELLAEPTAILLRCNRVGLLQKASYEDITDLELEMQQRLLFSVMLEAGLVNWHCGLIELARKQTGDNFVIAQWLIDWLWTEAADVRSKADDLCLRLFDASHIGSDVITADELRSLDRLETVMQKMCCISRHLVGVAMFSDRDRFVNSLAVTDAESADRAFLTMKEYLAVLNFFARHGLLPERSSLLDGVRSSATQEPLLIDGLLSDAVACKISAYWKERHPEWSKYPMPDLQSLLTCFLLESVPVYLKYALVLYALNDISGVSESVVGLFAEQFAATQGGWLPDLVYAMWNVDHGHGDAASDCIQLALSRGAPQDCLLLKIVTQRLDKGIGARVGRTEAFETFFSPHDDVRRLVDERRWNELFHASMSDSAADAFASLGRDAALCMKLARGRFDEVAECSHGAQNSEPMRSIAVCLRRHFPAGIRQAVWHHNTGFQLTKPSNSSDTIKPLSAAVKPLASNWLQSSLGRVAMTEVNRLGTPRVPLTPLKRRQVQGSDDSSEAPSAKKSRFSATGPNISTQNMTFAARQSFMLDQSSMELTDSRARKLLTTPRTESKRTSAVPYVRGTKSSLHGILKPGGRSPRINDTSLLNVPDDGEKRLRFNVSLLSDESSSNASAEDASAQRLSDASSLRDDLITSSSEGFASASESWVDLEPTPGPVKSEDGDEMGGYKINDIPRIVVEEQENDEANHDYSKENVSPSPIVESASPTPSPVAQDEHDDLVENMEVDISTCTSEADLRDSTPTSVPFVEEAPTPSPVAHAHIEEEEVVHVAAGLRAESHDARQQDSSPVPFVEEAPTPSPVNIAAAGSPSHSLGSVQEVSEDDEREEAVSEPIVEQPEGDSSRSASVSADTRSTTSDAFSEKECFEDEEQFGAPLRYENEDDSSSDSEDAEMSRETADGQQMKHFSIAHDMNVDSDVEGQDVEDEESDNESIQEGLNLCYETDEVAEETFDEKNSEGVAEQRAVQSLSSGSESDSEEEEMEKLQAVEAFDTSYEQSTMKDESQSSLSSEDYQQPYKSAVMSRESGEPDDDDEEESEQMEGHQESPESSDDENNELPNDDVNYVSSSASESAISVLDGDEHSRCEARMGRNSAGGVVSVESSVPSAHAEQVVAAPFVIGEPLFGRSVIVPENNRELPALSGGVSLAVDTITAPAYDVMSSVNIDDSASLRSLSDDIFAAVHQGPLFDISEPLTIPKTRIEQLNDAMLEDHVLGDSEIQESNQESSSTKKIDEEPLSFTQEAFGAETSAADQLNLGYVEPAPYLYGDVGIYSDLELQESEGRYGDISVPLFLEHSAAPLGVVGNYDVSAGLMPDAANSSTQGSTTAMSKNVSEDLWSAALLDDQFTRNELSPVVGGDSSFVEQDHDVVEFIAPEETGASHNAAFLDYSVATNYGEHDIQGSETLDTPDFLDMAMADKKCVRQFSYDRLGTLQTNKAPVEALPVHSYDSQEVVQSAVTFPDTVGLPSKRQTEQDMCTLVNLNDGSVDEALLQEADVEDDSVTLSPIAERSAEEDRNEAAFLSDSNMDSSIMNATIIASTTPATLDRRLTRSQAKTMKTTNLTQMFAPSSETPSAGGSAIVRKRGRPRRLSSASDDVSEKSSSQGSTQMTSGSPRRRPMRVTRSMSRQSEASVEDHGDQALNLDSLSPRSTTSTVSDSKGSRSKHVKGDDFSEGPSAYDLRRYSRSLSEEHVPYSMPATKTKQKAVRGKDAGSSRQRSSSSSSSQDQGEPRRLRGRSVGGAQQTQNDAEVKPKRTSRRL